MKGVRSVSREEAEEYRAHGVVLLKGLVGREWVETLERGVAENVKTPSQFSERLPERETHREGSLDECPPSFFNDYFNWQNIPDFADFVRHSGVAEVARDLMGSAKVNMYHEHVLIKEVCPHFTNEDDGM
jgi:ectoine hydroxylase-related dioxygenase (phytanoyl-CoA dioxygenase family)